MVDFSQMETKDLLGRIPALRAASEFEAAQREFLHDAGLSGSSIKALIEYQSVVMELCRRVEFSPTLELQKDLTEVCEWCDDRVANGFSHGEGGCFCSKCGEPQPRVDGVFCEGCRACRRCCLCEDE